MLRFTVSCSLRPISLIHRNLITSASAWQTIQATKPESDHRIPALSKGNIPQTRRKKSKRITASHKARFPSSENGGHDSELGNALSEAKLAAPGQDVAAGGVPGATSKPVGPAASSKSRKRARQRAALSAENAVESIQGVTSGKATSSQTSSSPSNCGSMHFTG
jgi:hypothetical protein